MTEQQRTGKHPNKESPERDLRHERSGSESHSHEGSGEVREHEYRDERGNVQQRTRKAEPVREKDRKAA